MNRRLADRLTLWGYRAAWALVTRLPAGLAYRAFDLAADVITRLDGRGVQRLRANYARVRPDLDTAGLHRLTAAGVRSYLRYWCEAFRLPVRTREELLAAVRVEGDSPVRAELAAGRSVVLFLGHMGNWDTAGAWGARELGPVTTVAERLAPEEVFAEFLSFRERLGMTILPLSGGGDVFRTLLEQLRSRPVLLPLLADRDLTRRGVEVEFCGHRARMAVGPAALAVTSGAALFPVSIHYERADQPGVPGGHRVVVVFHDRVRPPEHGSTRDKTVAMTQACADALGRAVREHTEDWHMMQRVFVDDLDPVPAQPARAG